MNILLELNYKQRNATRLLICFFGLVILTLAKDSTRGTLFSVLLLLLMLKYPKYVYAFVKTAGRDLVAGYRFIELNLYITVIEHRKWSLARVFQESVRKYPQKPCFLMEERAMTFQEVEDYSNKVGAYFKAKGLQHGDSVALLMETRPEYVCLWLGLSKIGVVTALINTNLRRETLLHSIKVASSKAIIVGTELVDVFREIAKDADLQAVPVYQYSDEAQRDNDNLVLMKGAVDLTKKLKDQSIKDLSADISACHPKHKLLYVYTSGTTGLPKAAVITNIRFVFMSSGTHKMIALSPTDIIYNPLPLYHTAGGMIGVGNALIHGCTVVLRKKFSASNFWKDCGKYKCSAAQYIGELCRYLLSTAQQPEDTQHQIRVMYGNGLRAQIWSQFMSRFNIPRIVEIYGSTEGNSNLANVANQIGAVGFVPFLIRYFFPVQIIKCNEETGDPIRNRRGLCIPCQPGETGLLVGKVSAKNAATAYTGYADKQASEKKLLRNVFRNGDVYFNSGDMFVSDILGYFYFKDRTGDTFRWRGENVATQEVEAIITSVIGLQDCVVYGVNIPHVEGKAGMAAIVDPARKVDLQQLSFGVRGSLPVYAQPLFVRIMNAIDHTATFKLKKRDLVLDAFDITKIKDPIYYLNRDGIYRPLTEEQFERLQNGTAGL